MWMLIAAANKTANVEASIRYVIILATRDFKLSLYFFPITLSERMGSKADKDIVIQIINSDEL